MSPKRFAAYIAAAVVVAWLAAPLLLSVFLKDLSQRGQFGDLFGSVNALFSGLAFASLLYTILLQLEQTKLQREELSLQREELKLQRQEMAASRAELANQARAQYALFKATVAQITVAAANAKIEARKLEADGNRRMGKRDDIDSIDAIARSLESLANKIEAETPDAA
jgi:uncharacterized membrane protein